MKKILVVLLVFAVAGGVFAQESPWNIGGGAGVNLKADFDGVTNVGGNTDYAGDNHANLDLTYVRGLDSGELKIGVGFSITGVNIHSAGMGKPEPFGWDKGAVGLSMGFEGDRYGFTANAPLKLVLNGGDAVGEPIVDALWGYYKLMDERIYLSAGYRGGGGGFWGSYASDYHDMGVGTLGDSLGDEGGLLANVALPGLDFGIKIPYLFTLSAPVDLIDDSLAKSVVGFKFVMPPVEFAAQFGFEDYKVYFGAKWNADPVTFGIGFNGTFGGATTSYAAGAGVNFNGGFFGANVDATFAAAGGKDGVLSVNPSFWYNVIEDSLKFSADVGFVFDKEIGWWVSPELNYNFRRTGAGDWSTGMGIKYSVLKLNGASENALYVGFKWGM